MLSTARKIELLAPVGTMEALRAAVQNGADAVYLGGKQFSARQYAANFDEQELAEVVKYAHLHGVRVFVAVNTLVGNREFNELLPYLHILYRLNIDAIIVQDLGAADAVRSLLPGMELHASTQMTIHNGAGARFLEKMGFTRAILAREVSLANVKNIGSAARIPLEVFVHGALCVCYSGQCLMSSMIGARSGNRGKCAQPCRLPYTLVNGAGEDIRSGHLLSPRDLNMIEHLPLLAEAGVVSLKVEGRMKRPEYVATVIRHYRNALDLLKSLEQAGTEGQTGYRVPPETGQELAQIFNREFTTGYFLEKPGLHLMSYQRPNNRGIYIGRVTGFEQENSQVTVRLEEPLRTGDGYEIWVTRGGRVAGEIRSLHRNGQAAEKAGSGETVSFPVREGRPRPGDRVFKTMDVELMEKARSTFLSPQGTRTFPLKMALRARVGEPLRLAAEDERGNKAEVQGEYLAVPAEKHPLTREVASRQLERLGNTIFSLHELTLDTDKNVLAPVSELNSLRRQVVAQLEELRMQEYVKKPIPANIYEEHVRKWQQDLLGEKAVAAKSLPSPRLSVTVGDLPSLKAALESGADTIYFGGELFRHKQGIGPTHFNEAIMMCRRYGAEAVLKLPRIYHEEKAEEIKDYCIQGKEAGPDGYMAGNPGTLQLALELGLTGLRADYMFNIFNDYTVGLLLKMGVKQMTLSPELTLEQIKDFRETKGVVFEVLAHGRLPLMITEHCAVGAVLGEGHAARGCPGPCRKGRYGLKDRMNMIFPLACDENCRMHVYNPKTLNMLDRLAELTASGVLVLRIEAAREEASWVRQTVSAYRREIDAYQREGAAFRMKEETKEMLKKLAPEGFTTGHYYRGV